MAERRRKPYVWVTWLAALLSGDSQCWWAAWFKAHYQNYEKLQKDEGFLSTWRARHNEVVAAEADHYRRHGYDVTLEDQNALRVEGRGADLSGKADIIAVAGAHAEIVDVKTGRRRESDWWQVVAYVVMHLMAAQRRLDGKTVTGRVAYRDGSRTVTEDDALAQRERVTRAMRDLSSDVPPRKVPSLKECEKCDIGECDLRVQAAAPAAQTEEF